MREHGVLDRVLLIYEAAMRKFSEGEDFDPDILTNSAQIVRDFIENYHEKSEEEAVFPRAVGSKPSVNSVGSPLTSPGARSSD